MTKIEKFITAEEIVELTGMSQGYAYKMIKELNEELRKKGYYTIRGRVSRYYFMERLFGPNVGEDNASVQR